MAQNGTSFSQKYFDSILNFSVLFTQLHRVCLESKLVPITLTSPWLNGSGDAYH